MSTNNLLSARNRSVSHASIRKRLLRSTSQDRKQVSKNTTTQSFRPFKPKLQRLLQQNKIQYIMNTDSHSKANLFYTTHINQMQKQLNTAKKALSTVVMKTKTKQYNINKLKDQLVRIEKDISILKGQGDVNKNKLNEVQDKFEKKVQGLQQKLWQQKSYKFMKTRLAKDQQYLNTQQIEIDRHIKQARQQLTLLQNNLFDQNQSKNKLQTNLTKAKLISKNQTDEKNQFIQLLNLQMAEKDMLGDLQVQNLNRQGQIRELMPSVIEKEQLQKYMQILFTHKLLSQIIKIKSQNLMQKYHNVQSAYMHIKSNTNIVELSKILARMQTQDQQYESLLKKVSTFESQLQDIQNNISKTVERQHQILSMDTNEDKNKLQINYQGVCKDQYDIVRLEKDKLILRKNEDDILKKKIMIWVAQHSQMFDINMKVKNEEDFFTQLQMLEGGLKKRFGDKN